MVSEFGSFQTQLTQTLLVEGFGPLAGTLHLKLDRNLCTLESHNAGTKPKQAFSKSDIELRRWAFRSCSELEAEAWSVH